MLTPPHNRHVLLGSSLEQFQQQIINQDQQLSLELNSSKEDKSKGDKLDYNLSSEYSHYPGFVRAIPGQSDGAVSHFAPRTAEHMMRQIESANQSAQQSQYQPGFRVENRRARPIIIKNFVGD